MTDVEALLTRHEGCRAVPYQDTLGNWTIGVGHLLSRPLSQRVIDLILAEDVAEATNECVHAFPWFADLTQARQDVLVCLCFNLGLTRLLKFHKCLTAMEGGQYETAASELLSSLWAQQVGPTRRNELAALIRGSEYV